MQELARQLVRIREQPAGVWTAEVVGLPEVLATSSSSQEALRLVRDRLEQGLALGQLVQVALRPFPPEARDPKDPLEQEFLEDLERYHREDLERTLKEYEQQWPSSSSTPTT
jgi:hypothetical protein